MQKLNKNIENVSGGCASLPNIEKLAFAACWIPKKIYHRLRQAMLQTGTIYSVISI